MKVEVFFLFSQSLILLSYFLGLFFFLISFSANIKLKSSYPQSSSSFCKPSLDEWCHLLPSSELEICKPSEITSSFLTDGSGAVCSSNILPALAPATHDQALTIAPGLLPTSS